MRRGWTLFLGAAFLAVGARAATYEFAVALDGKPVGTHRFVVEGDAGAQAVESEADFDVRFLGFQAYHYHHHAREQWQGDCLRALDAQTDDDGKPTRVIARREGDVTRVTTGATKRDDPACVMTFAYWNPAMRTQSRLLNPQTGKLEAVRIEKAGEGEVELGARRVPATRWRITGADAPIDLWIDAQGDWVGLDSVVGGRHALRYRRR